MKRETIRTTSGDTFDKVAELNNVKYFTNNYGMIYKLTDKASFELFIDLKTNQFITEVAEQQGVYILNQKDVVKCYLNCERDYYSIKEYFTV